MQGAAIVFHPGTTAPITVDLSGNSDRELAQALADMVGGHLELVPGFTSIHMFNKTIRCRAFCNENGKLDGLDVNGYATVLWERAMSANGGMEGHLSDVLCGPVVVVYGDAEFMEAL